MDDEEVYGSFWHLIRVRFDKVQGLLVTLFLGFISILTANSTSLNIGIALFIGLCLLLLAWIFYRAADDLYIENISLKLNKNSLPSVIEVKELDKEKDSALALCLLGPSDLFSYNALVTFYYNHGSYEQAIGLGEVVNIQDQNKIIQIELTHILKGHEEILTKLIQNNPKCLKQIRVKPIILKKYLIQLREGGM